MDIVEKVYNLRKRVDESVKENFGYCSDFTHELLDELQPLEDEFKRLNPELFEIYRDKYY